MTIDVWKALFFAVALMAAFGWWCAVWALRELRKTEAKNDPRSWP